MFYHKTILADGKVIKFDITDENVFTQCAECGRELPVDIAEVFTLSGGDLFSTSIICATCTANRHVARHMDGLFITVDGIALLADALCAAGCGELVKDLFDEYSIHSVQDLQSEEYEPFADALKAIATAGGGL